MFDSEFNKPVEGHEGCDICILEQQIVELQMDKPIFDSDICDPVTSMFNAYTTIRDMLLADGLFNMDIDDEVTYFRIWREHMATTPKNYNPIKFGSLQSKPL